MSVQITNLSSSQIRIVMTAGATTFTYDIYKRYVTLLQPGTPIVTALWHQYELDTHQRKLDIDYNDVTAPVVISSADLATQVQAFIDTIYSGGGAGTVTQVNTGTGLTGGPITGTGTVELNTKLAPADSLTGNSLKVLRVNVGETAVEYATPPAAPSNASETVAGIVEEATQAETNAGTDTGGTGARLFVVPSKLAVWIQQVVLTIDAVWHFVSSKLRLFNAAKTFYIEFTTSASANRTQDFQNLSGTIALTSIAGGGTNATAALSNNRVMQSSGGAIVEATAITAAKALKSDANGIPVHFDTATEPSLAELAYVKGVTSALQTQLDAITSKIQISITSGSDYTNGTTGLTNVTGMSFTAAVSGSYIFEMYIRYTGSATNGVRFAITFPSGGVLDAGLLIWSTAATNDQAAILQTSGAETATFGGTANNYFIKVAGSFVNGATGGSVQLQARSANVANTVTLFIGGFTKAIKV